MPETDTPEGLIYRFGAAFIRRSSGMPHRYRLEAENRRLFNGKGILLFKLVDTWAKDLLCLIIFRKHTCLIML